jgi:hypothetical protein
MKLVRACISDDLILSIRACEWSPCVCGDEVCRYFEGTNDSGQFTKCAWTDTSDLKRQIEQTRTAIRKLEDELFCLESLLDSTEEAIQ